MVAIYWMLILVATHLPPRDMPKVHVSDKLEHFGAYGLLSALLCACVPRLLSRSWWTSLVLLAIVAAYGAIDENTQPWFGRDCELNDWYADMIGATIAIAIMSFLVPMLWRRFGSRPPRRIAPVSAVASQLS